MRRLLNILWTVPGYQQSRALIGSLLKGYQLLLHVYRQPLDMSKRALWLAPTKAASCYYIDSPWIWASVHSDWHLTNRILAVIIWTAPVYEQARSLIGSLLTGYELLLYRSTAPGHDQARALISSLLTGYHLLLHRQPLNMSNHALWLAPYKQVIICY